MLFKFGNFFNTKTLNVVSKQENILWWVLPSSSVPTVSSIPSHSSTPITSDWNLDNNQAGSSTFNLWHLCITISLSLQKTPKYLALKVFQKGFLRYTSREQHLQSMTFVLRDIPFSGWKSSHKSSRMITWFCIALHAVHSSPALLITSFPFGRHKPKSLGNEILQCVNAKFLWHI